MQLQGPEGHSNRIEAQPARAHWSPLEPAHWPGNWGVGHPRCQSIKHSRAVWIASRAPTQRSYACLDNFEPAHQSCRLFGCCCCQAGHQFPLQHLPLTDTLLLVAVCLTQQQLGAGRALRVTIIMSRLSTMCESPLSASRLSIPQSWQLQIMDLVLKLQTRQSDR